ncbi:MAG TPA: polysaccharide biosynthesis protein [Polyangiaceae bacterium]
MCRQVARLAPASLLLVERAEFVLFDVDREIRRLWPGLNVVPLVGDVGDESRMRSIFEVHRPEVVLHAAAHKHVPLMEGNPGEAIRNNTLATRTLGRVAGESGAEALEGVLNEADALRKLVGQALQVQVLAPPAEPLFPVSPRPLRWSVLAGLAVAAIGALALLLLESPANAPRPTA